MAVLKVDIADKEKRRFEAEQFAARLENLTSLKFNEKPWCSLIGHVSVPAGTEKTLVFHLRSGAKKEIMIC